MVTKHQTMAAPEPAPGLVSRAVGQVRQFICGLHGHDALLHFEHGRMALRCTSCGHQTPGWDLRSGVQQPDLVETKSRVLQLPLVRQRRVA